MLDNKEEHYEDEEAAYHFADEELEEAEPERAPPAAEKEAFMTKVMRYRRMILSVCVLFVLVYVVFKMLAPPSPPPVTGFQTPPVSAPKTVPPAAVTAQPLSAPASAKPAPVAPSTPTVSATPTTQSVQPTAVGPTVSPQMQAGAPVNTVAPELSAPAAAPATTQPTAPLAAVPAAPASEAEQIKALTDKIALLEQQNTAIMNLLQTEYAQKMSDYETQSQALRGKVDVLARRMNRLDASMNQASQGLDNSGQMLSTPATLSGVAKSLHPKVIYTVQAIIPGRAWLKTESGDVVTVAEGDTLKGMGRVTKIDPYDGIVNIDLGNHKIITLSYGNSGEE